MPEPEARDLAEERRKTRRERFLTVAERRTGQILHLLRLLGNCANKSSYEYTEEEIAKIFDAIQQELAATRSRFEGRKGVTFTLR